MFRVGPFFISVTLVLPCFRPYILKIVIYFIEILNEHY